MSTNKIPVSVVVVTFNEAQNLARCLCALEQFDEVLVIDSQSTDATAEIAKSFHVPCINFVWNKKYPKKRQWVLDNIPLKHDFVFFVDADEVITPKLRDEIGRLDFSCAGYFVKGAYVIDGKILRYGLHNNKLCLFHKGMMEFPVVDDLDIPGMGEIEGHYQPVLKDTAPITAIGQLKNPLNHYAMEDMGRWMDRQNKYTMWHKEIVGRNALPRDHSKPRRMAKRILFHTRFGAFAAFVLCYIVRRGFLDGRAGFNRAKSIYDYYKCCQ